MVNPNEVGWYGYWCSYCQAYTWMAQFEGDKAGNVNCRRCKYNAQRIERWYSHAEFMGNVVRTYS
jgi:Zn ribbon nucleic-acid-binding protein